MKEWMAQVDPPKEAGTLESMDGWPQILSSNKMTYLFKEWTAESGIRKKDIVFIEKDLSLK